MPAARRWRARLVVAFAEPADARAGLEVRLACWFERIAQLIARRDTPRSWPSTASPAAGTFGAPANHD